MSENLFEDDTQTSAGGANLDVAACKYVRDGLPDSGQRTICIYAVINVHCTETTEKTKAQTVVMTYYCDSIGVI
mgnify:CR=1 FL=1